MGDYVVTQQRIIQSGLLMQRAKERLGRSGDELQESVKSVRVDPLSRTSILAITVEALDPVLSAEFANALAEEYLEEVEVEEDAIEARIRREERKKRIREIMEEDKNGGFFNYYILCLIPLFFFVFLAVFVFFEFIFYGERIKSWDHFTDLLDERYMSENEALALCNQVIHGYIRLGSDVPDDIRMIHEWIKSEGRYGRLFPGEG